MTPIPKTGDMSDINNIRPISQTPIIGKLLEKHVNEQIVTYLEDNKLLYPLQGGFRKKQSTIKSIFNMVYDFYLARNEYSQVLTSCVS